MFLISRVFQQKTKLYYEVTKILSLEVIKEKLQNHLLSMILKRLKKCLRDLTELFSKIHFNIL